MKYFGTTCLLILLTACGGGDLTPTRDGGGSGDAAADAAGRDGGGGDGGGGGDTGTPPACGSITATVRDFHASHPDMEAFLGSLTGIVEPDLGSDGLPVYAHPGPTAVTSGPEAFDPWYRDVDGVNMRFTVALPLTEGPAGVFTYDNPNFFPLDGMGFGEEIDGHNFHFTTEIHTRFVYRGGEVFTFRGDDDVFLFVNNHLALDLGGVHGPEEGTVDFDAMASELGITPGLAYKLDIFHAERHTSMSNFRMETSIDCFLLE